MSIQDEINSQLLQCNLLPLLRTKSAVCRIPTGSRRPLACWRTCAIDAAFDFPCHKGFRSQGHLRQWRTPR